MCAIIICMKSEHKVIDGVETAVFTMETQLDKDAIRAAIGRVSKEKTVGDKRQFRQAQERLANLLIKGVTPKK